MNSNSPSNREGQHAFLSPSKPAWLNYDEDKLNRVFTTAMKARRGTQLHEFAKSAIRLGVRMPDDNATINAYVNDAIRFFMTPEKVLEYSAHCFGTADAVGFRNNTLRIHDLKTGQNPTSMAQLEVYTALFCLEYRFDPFKIDMELRIYQSDQIKVHFPDPDDIKHIMEKIKYLSKILDALLAEEVPL